MQFIVADVGGTNTRVALSRGNELDHGTITRFANRDFAGLDELLQSYVEQRSVSGLTAAAVAVAGPVTGGVGRLTNLDWAIDSDTLCRATGAANGVVMNDLVAQGYGLGLHAPGTASVLLERASGETNHRDSQLVVGIGTGFNAAPVHETPNGRHVVPSECGHITLPAVSKEDCALVQHLCQSHGFPGIEEVLSGRGLLALYRQACGREDAQSGELAQALEARDDDALAAAAVFTRAMGMVIGDLALVHLPFSGIHLIGGVARAVAPLISDPDAGRPFREGFYSKGRFSEFMKAFSIHLIGDDFAALTGMADHLQQRFAR